MSTRSVIGILNEDMTVNSVYSHYDGYPEHNGYFFEKVFRHHRKGTKFNIKW